MLRKLGCTIGQILNRLTCVEYSQGLSRKVTQMTNLTSENYYTCYVFPVLRVLVICGDSQGRNHRV
jgi:hypothetical protein